MRSFAYLDPETVPEAVALLREHGSRARLLAGGTVLIPELKSGKVRPDYVIQLKKIAGLKEIREDGEGLHIGALVPQAEMEEEEPGPMVPPALWRRIPGSLRRMISRMANPQVRNLATLAGNLAWGSPAADSAPPLLALEAVLKVQGPGGERAQPLDGFFLGPGRVNLEPGEMITEVVIPARSLGRSGASEKFMKRRANVLSVSSAAVAFHREEGGRLREVRIAVGAVAPVPLRLRKAEALLEGQVWMEEHRRALREAVAEEIRPVTDLRSTDWFRRRITPILVERCLEGAAV